MESVRENQSLTLLDTYPLSILFKKYPDGVVCKDKNLCYINVNKGYLQLFSVENDSNILGQSENKYLSEENIRLIHDADTQTKDSLLPINYVINIGNRLLNITTSPVINEGLFAGLISVVKDITHEEYIIEQFVNKHFKQINDEKQLQSQRETFVASIGHDLKNPTIAQIRSLELVLKGAFGKLSPEQEEILGMVLDSCKYMKGMLSTLLSTYRNYGGAIKLNFEEFSLSELVSECISEMIYVARDKNIGILTEFCEESTVYADLIQIKRVIMNLLSNGIKYAYNSTDLKLKIFKGEEDIYFQFENKSPYIPEDKQKSIFARYVSYMGVNKELGIGLGLYASKKIIESHRGEIYVYSYPDNRNIFGFKIPVKQDSNTAMEVLL